MTVTELTAAKTTDASELAGAMSKGGDATPATELQGRPLQITRIVQQGERQDGTPYAVAEAVPMDSDNPDGDTVSFFVPGKRLFPILINHFAQHPNKPVEGYLLKDPTINGESYRGWQLVSMRAEVSLSRTGGWIAHLPAK